MEKRTFDDGVRAHLPRLFAHAGYGFFARFVQQLGIAFEFAADDVFQPGHDVAADVFGADGGALHEAEVADDGAAGNGFDIGDQHGRVSFFAIGNKTGLRPSEKGSYYRRNRRQAAVSDGIRAVW